MFKQINDCSVFWTRSFGAGFIGASTKRKLFRELELGWGELGKARELSEEGTYYISE